MLGYHPSNTSLIKLVPARHFYPQLLEEVDFGFIRPLFDPFCSAIGRPSIDPGVFVKLLLVGHFENITSGQADFADGRDSQCLPATATRR